MRASTRGSTEMSERSSTRSMVVSEPLVTELTADMLIRSLLINVEMSCIRPGRS